MTNRVTTRRLPPGTLAYRAHLAARERALGFAGATETAHEVGEIGEDAPGAEDDAADSWGYQVYSQVLLPQLRGWATALLGGEHPIPQADRHPWRAQGLAVVLPIWIELYRPWMRRVWRELSADERMVLEPYLP